MMVVHTSAASSIDVLDAGQTRTSSDVLSTREEGVVPVGRVDISTAVPPRIIDFSGTESAVSAVRVCAPALLLPSISDTVACSFELPAMLEVLSLDSQKDGCAAWPTL